jgi:lipopolysaccharide export LptBFGC system permease protein LptF
MKWTNKLLIATASLALVSVTVWSVAAQPSGDLSANSARSIEPGQRQMPPGARRMAEHFEEQIKADTDWLRQNGLGRFADEMDKLSQAGEQDKRVSLWRLHRRVEQLRNLTADRPQDAKRAIDEVQAEFDVVDLAKQYRSATEADRKNLEPKLKDALQKQFDLRLETQRAMAKAIEERLKKLHQQLKDQETLRDKLLDQRYQDLINPERPAPEPELAPPPPPGRGPNQRPAE